MNPGRRRGPRSAGQYRAGVVGRRCEYDATGATSGRRTETQASTATDPGDPTRLYHASSTKALASFSGTGPSGFDGNASRYAHRHNARPARATDMKSTRSTRRIGRHYLTPQSLLPTVSDPEGLDGRTWAGVLRG